jgi:hypothetical protein
MKLVIDDAYFKDNYPLPFQVDTKRLGAVISMTQRTELRDIVGDSFYQYLMEYLENGEEDEGMESVLEEIRFLHTLYTARALFTTYYKDGDKDTREYNISYLDGSVKTQEAFVINAVQNNSYLYGIASESTDNVFDDDADSFNTIYYPD